MRRLMAPLMLVLLATGGAAAVGLDEPSDAAKPPEIKLGETPSSKLGSAPHGFGLKVGAKAPDATLGALIGFGLSPRARRRSVGGSVSVKMPAWAEYGV